MVVKEVAKKDKSGIAEIVKIHLDTFEGFFLTFMGEGFLKIMYKCYCEHEKSGLLAVTNDEKTVGFLAYSYDISNLYKYMIKKKLFLFAWYSLLAFFRKPKIFIRLIKAFLKPGETKRQEKYVEISSIGVSPAVKGTGVGSKLMSYFKEHVNMDGYEYVNLETDAENNDAVNNFYMKNGFRLERTYVTSEGRKMNEYRWRK